jgi:peroxiredoxin
MNVTTRFRAASAFFVASLLFASCGNLPPETSTETVLAAGEQRQPAPDFSLKDVHSADVKLSEFKGKVVLLNFWATWCGPCKIEMPWFVEFQREYKDRGFSVIAVSMDEEGWDIVRPFTEELKLNFPVVVGDDRLADEYGGVSALPTTFIIDKEGRIAATHQGLVSKGDYEDEIERLL